MRILSLNNVEFGIIIMQGLACIIGFLCWARLKPVFWRTFPFYLLIITCCEFACRYMNANDIKGADDLKNNFVIPLGFLFAHFLYYKNLPHYFRKTVISLSVIYLVAFLVDVFFLQELKWTWTLLSYGIGNIMMLILGIIYFLQLLSSDKVATYKNQPFYWVNLGVMLFYMGTFPYYAVLNSKEKAPEIFRGLSCIYVSLNYVMYTFFILSFLWNKKK